MADIKTMTLLKPCLGRYAGASHRQQRAQPHEQEADVRRPGAHLGIALFVGAAVKVIGHGGDTPHQKAEITHRHRRQCPRLIHDHPWVVARDGYAAAALGEHVDQGQHHGERNKRGYQQILQGDDVGAIHAPPLNAGAHRPPVRAVVGLALGKLALPLGQLAPVYPVGAAAAAALQRTGRVGGAP